ncbi:hypothetical protein, partial [Cupriavidus sp. BIS7]|uniref:hypothetical protein n=1 Tax=Cupriavidus sp. BIS7 TaxID=1217718 RepID=UPI00055CD68C
QHNGYVKRHCTLHTHLAAIRMIRYKPLILMNFRLVQKTGNVRENLTRQRLTGCALGLFTKLSTEALDK